MELKKLLEQHNLTIEEYERIKEALGREPNLTELGVFSVMWSEHCSYKSSKVHLKKLPTKGERVVQGPGENAGIVDIGDGYVAIFKIESHNHPSFIEPYQGAATGVGGILRDIFTMGARPVAVLDSLRFGELDNPLNRRTFKGVVAGISGYGNSVGVPTVGGETCFDNSYTDNPLVNVFCLGIAKKDKVFYAKADEVGAKVFYAGAKTGRDGIHGATMASAEFDESLEEKRPNVQVGDPFKEKLLIEACLEVMDKNLISSIQDMGAAGLTSSSVEMAGRGGTGIEIDVALIPQREEGMTPYEILLSESQERMLLIAKQGKEDELKRVFNKWDLDIVEIGKINDSGKFTVKENDKIVAEIPVKFLTDSAPVYNRKYLDIFNNRETGLSEKKIKIDKSVKEIIDDMINDSNLAKKNWVYEQYDHMVQTNSVIPPGRGAAVIRVKGTNKYLAITVDGNPDLVYLNPYEGAKRVVTEGYLNIITTGATPIGATNCLNFGNPEKPEIMGEFKNAVEGMAEACEYFNTPITGGNVSFYNETNGVPIKPTPVFGLVGVIEGEENIIYPDFKDEGDLIYIIGNLNFGFDGSYFVKKYLKQTIGKIEKTPMDIAKKIGGFVLSENKMIKSANDVSNGGLFINIIESADFYKKGVKIEIPENIDEKLFLFGETSSQIVITVSKEDKNILEQKLENLGLDFINIGEIIKENILIEKNNKILYEDSILNVSQRRERVIPEILKRKK